jgi:hypothetical protein
MSKNISAGYGGYVILVNEEIVPQKFKQLRIRRKNTEKY